MSELHRYYASVLRHGAGRSTAFAHAWGLVASLVLAALGLVFGIGYQIHHDGGFKPAMSDLHQLTITALMSGFAPIVVVGLLTFIIYLVRAPAELAAVARCDRRRFQQKYDLEVAGYVAQIDELKARLSAPKPDLFFTIEQCLQLPYEMGAAWGSTLLLDITLRNTGARTAISDWKLEAQPITKEPVLPKNDSYSEMFLRQNRLTSVLKSAPFGISQGDILQGVLLFDVSGLNMGRTQEIKRVLLNFKDAFGEEHLAEWPKPPDVVKSKS